MDPGPLDSSVLYEQESHRSKDVWDAHMWAVPASEESSILVCRRQELRTRRRDVIDPQILEYVDCSGFAGLSLVPFIELDWHLITALIERWRPETHTFHFPPGEMTITLQDVGIQMGLPVDGLPVTGLVVLNEQHRVAGVHSSNDSPRFAGTDMHSTYRPTTSHEVPSVSSQHDVMHNEELRTPDFNTYCGWDTFSPRTTVPGMRVGGMEAMAGLRPTEMPNQTQMGEEVTQVGDPVIQWSTDICRLSTEEDETHHALADAQMGEGTTEEDNVVTELAHDGVVAKPGQKRAHPRAQDQPGVVAPPLRRGTRVIKHVGCGTHSPPPPRRRAL